MEHKEIYYYNPKYPEHGIETLPLVDIKWLQSEVDDTNKHIYAIITNVNIETGYTFLYDHPYTVYCPYEDDRDMFVLDLSGNRERILSFNREKLEEWWKEEVRTQYNIMKKRLEELEKCLNQK